MANIEENLRELAKAKGLKLTDIADRMGTTVSNLLSSVKGNPTVSKLEDLADALQVSVAELFTLRPASAQGIVIIGGEAYQISKPSKAVVQLPIYQRYDFLRDQLRKFIAVAITDEKPSSKVGMLDTLEVFTLTYDPSSERFLLTLCYSTAKVTTLVYDKFEFCDWSKSTSPDDAPWDLPEITDEIINDIEGYVPLHLNSSTEPPKRKRKEKEDFDFDPDEIIKELKELYSDDNNQEE